MMQVSKPQRSSICRATCQQGPNLQAHLATKSSRRTSLLLGTSIALSATGLSLPKDTLAAELQITSDKSGFGTRAAQENDLLLLHYVGTLQESGAVFDSTRGGLTYRDGGPGVARPVIIRLGGGPVPGICKGLRQALLGMRIGGTRTVVVPSDLGFGDERLVLAPYAQVPPGSTLQYEIEVLRLSNRGPDELTKGIDRCGQGGAAQQVANCNAITYAEFLL